MYKCANLNFSATQEPILADLASRLAYLLRDFKLSSNGRVIVHIRLELRAFVYTLPFRYYYQKIASNIRPKFMTRSPLLKR